MSRTRKKTAGAFVDHKLNIALVGNYVPRRCGIATFSADICASLRANDQVGSVQVVAMNDKKAHYAYPLDDIAYEIDESDLPEYQAGVDLINRLGFDVVSLQHEFGIFGGSYGSHIVTLLQNLEIPVVTTLHTVLPKPDAGQLAVTKAISRCSDRLIVMSASGKDLLEQVYGVEEDKISVVFHGVPDIPFIEPDQHKAAFNWQGRKILMTFGLLSAGKGLEYVIEALPAIVAENPEVLYVILGSTHPNVILDCGESYRNSLVSLAKRLGVEGNVLFIDEFVELTHLCSYLQAVDVYITPYANPDQVVSGSLSYALAAGNAIVSTPYLYAQEFLAEGRGRFVPFQDSAGVATEINELLGNENLRREIRRAAHDFSRTMRWPQVADRYVEVFSEAEEARRYRALPGVRERHLKPTFWDMPEVKFDHLYRLSDDVGIMQHAKYSVPNRRHGYCTDDNARALIAAVLGSELFKSEKKLRALKHRYLGFLDHAFEESTGRFHNFLGYDRRWLDEAGSEDSHARAMWALGTLIEREPDKDLGDLAVALFDRALPAVRVFEHPRAQAYAVLGLIGYLKRFPGARRVKGLVQEIGGEFIDRFNQQADDTWLWVGETLTYDNGRIPEALILSAAAVVDGAMLEIGLKMLKWLMDIQTDRAGHLTPIGNRGWFRQKEEPARFDQQPLEAQCLFDACLAAAEATGDEEWETEAHRCLEWFLGRNDLGVSLYDSSTGGCCDGLHYKGINRNQGAESTLAWLLSAIKAGHRRRPTQLDVDGYKSQPEPGLGWRNV